MAPEQAMDSLMPGFDKEIAKMAQRLLINPRKIDYHTGVLATKVTPGTHPLYTPHSASFTCIRIFSIVQVPSSTRDIHELKNTQYFLR
jgi:hypothetical protein